jgi:uncharacterized protein (DUF1501 family)
MMRRVMGGVLAALLAGTGAVRGDVSQSLQMVAKTIAARQTLGMKRQTFFILLGGWDHHDEVLNAQTG